MLQSLQRILSDTGVQPRHQMTEEEWQRHATAWPAGKPAAVWIEAASARPYGG